MQPIVFIMCLPGLTGIAPCRVEDGIGTFIETPTWLVGVVTVEDTFIVESLLTTRFNGAFRHPVGGTEGEVRGTMEQLSHLSAKKERCGIYVAIRFRTPRLANLVLPES
jgi:hypothetical protein